MNSRCQGWPQYGCTKPSIATVAGYRLCRDCLFAHSQRDKDATIQSLREQLATAHETLGAAKALLHKIDQPQESIAIGVVLMAIDKAMQ